MAIDGKEMIASDILFDECTIKINPKTVSIITEKHTTIYRL